MIIDSFCAVLAAAGPGSEVSGRPELPQLLLRLPRDRDEAAMVACVVLHRLSWATELCGLELLRRLLPSWHPLHEGRGFAASLAATPLYLPRLCMFPLYALPQPHLEWKGLFARPAGGWRWFFYIHTLQTAVNMAVGKAVGAIAAWPLQRARPRFLQALRRRWFEGPQVRTRRLSLARACPPRSAAATHARPSCTALSPRTACRSRWQLRLARKLQKAAEHAEQLHG